MKPLTKIIKLLERDKIQRYIYGIGLIIWLLVWFRSLKYSFQNFDKITLSAQGEYWIIVSIPLILFILQIIFNNKKIWFLIFTIVILTSIYILWTLIIFNIFVDFNRDYAPPNFWTLKRVINLLLIPLVIILINWVVWKLKPIQRPLHKS